MVHLRIVVPSLRAKKVLDLLDATRSACNLVYLEGAARRPAGDVILCDIAREDASVVIDDLKELGVHRDGSISLEQIDSQVSDAARAAERAAPGMPSDAVVWEEVEARTSETIELGGNFLAFMVLACLIASIGIFTRLADPDRRRDGRRARVRPPRRPLRRDRSSAGAGWPALPRRARRSASRWGSRAAFLFTLICVATGLVDPRLPQHRQPAHPVHRQA